MATQFHATFRDYTAPSGWTLSRALRTLDIGTEKFDPDLAPHADGYSHDRVVAISSSPVLWTVPIIAAHEIAHIVLGHTAFVVAVQRLGLSTKEIPFRRFEVEAHLVARAVTRLLKLPTEEMMAEEMQTYIDSVWRSDDLDDTTAVSLARATLTIVAAGEAVHPEGNLTE